jgi:DNA repair protein RadC
MVLSSQENGRIGFSEEALRGLDDMELRLPPGQVYVRVQAEAAGPRPHYWGHRERLRRRFLEGGHAAMPEY